MAVYYERGTDRYLSVISGSDAWGEYVSFGFHPHGETTVRLSLENAHTVAKDVLRRVGADPTPAPRAEPEKPPRYVYHVYDVINTHEYGRAVAAEYADIEDGFLSFHIEGEPTVAVFAPGGWTRVVRGGRADD